MQVFDKDTHRCEGKVADFGAAGEVFWFIAVRIKIK